MKEKLKRKFLKLRKPYDEWWLNHRIDKLANAIWKYSLKESLDPVYTKDDAVTIAIGIMWNDADDILKLLSYTDSRTGERIFPR